MQVVEALRNLSCGILLSSYGDEELAYRLQASQIKLGRGSKLLNGLGIEAHDSPRRADRTDSDGSKFPASTHFR
jgi:hypothetical protein